MVVMGVSPVGIPNVSCLFVTQWLLLTLISVSTDRGLQSDICVFIVCVSSSHLAQSDEMGAPSVIGEADPTGMKSDETQRKMFHIWISRETFAQKYQIQFL